MTVFGAEMFFEKHLQPLENHTDRVHKHRTKYVKLLIYIIYYERYTNMTLSILE